MTEVIELYASGLRFNLTSFFQRKSDQEKESMLNEKKALLEDAIQKYLQTSWYQEFSGLVKIREAEIAKTYRLWKIDAQNLPEVRVPLDALRGISGEYRYYFSVSKNAFFKENSRAGNENPQYISMSDFSASCRYRLQHRDIEALMDEFRKAFKEARRQFVWKNCNSCFSQSKTQSSVWKSIILATVAACVAAGSAQYFF